MPSHYDTHYEDDTQDWDPVVFKRNIVQNKNESKSQISEQIPLHRQLFLARSRNGYTAHEFSQKLHMKISMYQKIESGIIPPPPECIPKLRKYLGLRI